MILSCLTIGDNVGGSEELIDAHFASNIIISFKVIDVLLAYDEMVEEISAKVAILDKNGSSWRFEMVTS